MRIPKIPQWGWILLVIVALWYVFGGREGLENAPKKHVDSAKHKKD